MLHFGNVYAHCNNPGFKKYIIKLTENLMFLERKSGIFVFVFFLFYVFTKGQQLCVISNIQFLFSLRRKRPPSSSRLLPSPIVDSAVDT